jgi:hypothetical protein
MPNPMIQIDDEIREMTDAEYEKYQTEIASADIVPPVE